MNVYNEPETKRNAAMARYAASNPCASLREIGEYHGITRQRVHEILKHEGAGPKPDARTMIRQADPLRHCVVCNAELLTAPSTLRRSRLNGGRPAKCEACTRAKMVPIECRHCGETFSVPESLVLNQMTKYVDPLRHCPACMHPPCADCGIPVKGSPQAVWAWRNGDTKAIRCTEHRRSYYRGVPP